MEGIDAFCIFLLQRFFMLLNRRSANRLPEMAGKPICFVFESRLSPKTVVK